ncbi:MAG: methyltransferase [Pseudomonadota bacterium]
MKTIATMGSALAIILSGCTMLDQSEPADVSAETVETTVEAAVEATSNDALLTAILAAQPDETKARYDARNPAETIEFFGLEPGMTVVEALPGGGWYSKILMPYLGPEGELVGAHYPDTIWPKFGMSEERVASFIERGNNWVTTASKWDVDNPSAVSNFKMGALPDEKQGTADAVLFIRALHNLNRFEESDGYLTTAMEETMAVLKPGGIVGVVQHAAPETNPDEWTDGSRGYLKKSALISAFEEAGFEYVGESDVNANPLDVPGEGDIVWRLPPSLNGTQEGTPERAAVEAIGESNRMTLKFRKPA